MKNNYGYTPLQLANNHHLKNEIIQQLTMFPLEGGANKYYIKYIKYKTKYLHLKFNN